MWPRPVDPGSEARASALLQGAVEAAAAVHILTVLAHLLLVDALDLCGERGGSAFEPLAGSPEASLSARSTPDRASGCPELRPASASQPLGPHWPATRALFPTSPSTLQRLSTTSSPAVEAKPVGKPIAAIAAISASVSSSAAGSFAPAGSAAVPGGAMPAGMGMPGGGGAPNGRPAGGGAPRGGGAPSVGGPAGGFLPSAWLGSVVGVSVRVSGGGGGQGQGQWSVASGRG